MSSHIFTHHPVHVHVHVVSTSTSSSSMDGTSYIHFRVTDSPFLRGGYLLPVPVAIDIDVDPPRIDIDIAIPAFQSGYTVPGYLSGFDDPRDW